MTPKLTATVSRLTRIIWIAILMVLTVGVCIGQASVPGPGGSQGGTTTLDDAEAFEHGSEPSECWSHHWPEEDAWPIDDGEVAQQQLPVLETYWIGDLGFE